jgi:hypothetical protein
MGKVHNGIKTCATMPTVKVYNGKRLVHIPTSLVGKQGTEKEEETQPQLIEIPEVQPQPKRTGRVNFQKNPFVEQN